MRILFSISMVCSSTLVLKGEDQGLTSILFITMWPPLRRTRVLCTPAYVSDMRILKVLTAFSAQLPGFALEVFLAPTGYKKRPVVEGVLISNGGKIQWSERNNKLRNLGILKMVMSIWSFRVAILSLSHRRWRERNPVLTMYTDRTDRHDGCWSSGIILLFFSLKNVFRAGPVD